VSNQLRSAFEYLKATESLYKRPTGVLGEEPKPGSISEEQARAAAIALDLKLSEYYAHNKRTFILLQVMLGVLLVVGIWLIWYYHNAPSDYKFLFGETGVFAGMLGVIKLMLNTLRYKVAMDLIMGTLPSWGLKS
jgi:hypothetical protein